MFTAQYLTGIILVVVVDFLYCLVCLREILLHKKIKTWNKFRVVTAPVLKFRAPGCNEHQDAEIQLQGEPLKRVERFTYLGSTLAEDGELDAEVTHRVQSGWKNWKRVSGVLCDRRMNMKIKGNVYRTVV